MKLINSVFTLFVLLFTLGSCEEKCDEPDIELINSIYIELKQGGADGFSDEELSSIYLVRYIPNSNPLVADTIYPQGTFPEGQSKFLINDTYPLVNETPPYWVVFGYEIIEPTTEFSTRIQDIELEGLYDGDCGYTNVRKTFTVDSVLVDMSGSQEFYLVTRE